MFAFCLFFSIDFRCLRLSLLFALYLRFMLLLACSFAFGLLFSFAFGLLFVFFCFCSEGGVLVARRLCFVYLKNVQCLVVVCLLVVRFCSRVV